MMSMHSILCMGSNGQITVVQNIVKVIQWVVTAPNTTIKYIIKKQVFAYFFQILQELNSYDPYNSQHSQNDVILGKATYFGTKHANDVICGNYVFILVLFRNILLHDYNVTLMVFLVILLVTIITCLYNPPIPLYTLIRQMCTDYHLLTNHELRQLALHITQ